MSLASRMKAIHHPLGADWVQRMDYETGFPLKIYGLTSFKCLQMSNSWFTAMVDLLLTSLLFVISAHPYKGPMTRGRKRHLSSAPKIPRL
jgi:hypothetical protein